MPFHCDTGSGLEYYRFSNLDIFICNLWYLGLTDKGNVYLLTMQEFLQGDIPVNPISIMSNYSDLGSHYSLNVSIRPKTKVSILLMESV